MSVFTSSREAIIVLQNFNPRPLKLRWRNIASDEAESKFGMKQKIFAYFYQFYVVLLDFDTQ